MTMRDGLGEITRELMLVPGLSGHEDRVRRAIAARLKTAGLAHQSDVLGNLWTTLPGDGPSVMVFAHMDQLGFVVRKVDACGLVRLERLGGVPERALAAQPVLICVGEGRDVPGIIANKSHHATRPDEKYRVLPYGEVFVDAGFADRAAAEAAGVRIGTPVVYRPDAQMLGADRLAGTSVDDRAGCAALIVLAGELAGMEARPTVHVSFTVQEEFNLRGAQVLAQRLQPDIAIQIDLMLATDTPDMAAGDRDMALQRSAQTGILTDLSYVQLVGNGVAAIDLGFPMRYSHSAQEVCDLRDLEGLVHLLSAGIGRIGPEFSLERDG